MKYSGGWNFTDVKRIDISEKELSKYLVRKGDILYNRTNSKELVGKTAVYRREDPMAYAGYLIRIRPNNQNNSEYSETSKVGFDDLDDAKLKRFVERAGLTWDSPTNALEKLGLIKEGRLLNAAPLFFCQNRHHAAALRRLCHNR